MQTFTIVVSHVLFELTATQLSKEPKSVLHTYFLQKHGKPKEKSEALVLHSDPVIFQTIHRYLDGYDILSRVPMGTSEFEEYSNRLSDILRDAERLKLNKLGGILRTEIQRLQHMMASPKYCIAKAQWNPFKEQVGSKLI